MKDYPLDLPLFLFELDAFGAATSGDLDEVAAQHAEQRGDRGDETYDHWDRSHEEMQFTRAWLVDLAMHIPDWWALRWWARRWGPAAQSLIGHET